MMSMMKFVLFCRENGINCTIYPITFESLISRARNAAVAHFMSDPEATHILFIDSDIEFNNSDIAKLVKADKDVVCGSYPQKWLDMSKYSHSAENPLHLCVKHSVHLDLDTPNPESSPDILNAKYCTTGFLLIKRGVFESLRNAFPDKHYINDIDGYSGASPDMFYDFFPVTIEPLTKRYESEDYGFSRMWTSIGGTIHVIPDITLKHYGWFAYEGNLKNFMHPK